MRRQRGVTWTARSCIDCGVVAAGVTSMDREQLRRLRGVASTARSCIECGWHGARGGASTARSSIEREKPAQPAGLAGLAGLAAPAGLAGLPGLAALAALAGLAGQQNDARTLATAIFWRGCFEIPSYSLIIATFLDFAHEAVLSGGPVERPKRLGSSS